MSTFVQRVASAANLNEHSVNPNSHWVNLKGSWTTNIVLIIVFRLVFGVLPWSTPELCWTLTNLSYCLFQYIMFHGIIGTPFEVNQGAYDNLTLWEQMDNGEQYTPTKKFLTVVPIVVFLLSTHYTYYDVPTFIINFTAVLIVLIAKLPAFHRVRFFGINMGQNDYN
ncbi:sphingolipid homeostasis protein orm1 [Coemansia aciculifera]|uniref:Sphingolipid homeostasis protein orm1 n=3 Tax=Coemansia TaxID=4863 RepID=A0A9W8GNW3_9FUNG|nr:sphingolipid homeostasis protein orm1 [Coemansia sp. RSA 2675]KAJ2348161.1 sphingolipid homeostasis protein orm1 [Coemansia sp. RSA 2671]KAJ2350921.1 sphingolipid homeostasis protein orm1 [Coemansia sp. RSA 2611]KAJ2410900.1 sphingolipid homeostasis protein orm1 [Coemansia sp. RSA 2530]KAJ2491431.1 sphingolipid homeostasis protein orm1 [Coemansia sp. RSA 2050]KAJ2690039.1 sphingolipid homeostasis protein orm1 [Coemansia spiralis]KAJ2702491.1 sphingolipid homeostasis protein orm1 [Coemansia